MLSRRMLSGCLLAGQRGPDEDRGKFELKTNFKTLALRLSKKALERR